MTWRVSEKGGGRIGFWELREALIFGNRFAQMQIDISLARYALAFVSCQEQGWMKQESTPFRFTPVLQPAQSLSTINSICWPTLHFIPLSSTSKRTTESTEAIPALRKLLPVLSSNSLNHTARTKTNWEASLLGPRLTFLLPFYFSAIHSS